MGSLEDIKHLASQSLVNESQFVVEVRVPSGKAPGKLTVIIDGDKGITIDDCAEVSRNLSKALDDAGWMERKYLLEVSTPGLDQPLKLVRQYRKNIGRSLKVKTSNGNVEGALKEVQNEGIVLTELLKEGKKKEMKETYVPFTIIERAQVLISFK